MTREEAINCIKYGLIEGNYPLPKEIGIEALNMAIKALEQEPKIVPVAEIKFDEDKLKSRVAVDLYSVIKQNYIERDVLDKIRTEIGKSKTEHEMQIAEKDEKTRCLISHIYCDIVNILNKCKEESDDKK